MTASGKARRRNSVRAVMMFILSVGRRIAGLDGRLAGVPGEILLESTKLTPQGAKVPAVYRVAQCELVTECYGPA